MSEIDYLISQADSPRDKLIVRILSHTGIRVTELLNLSQADIDFANHTILIHAEKGGEHKAKRRLIPIDPDTLAMIKAYAGDKRGLLFDLTRQRIDQIIKALAKKIGLRYVLDFYSGKHEYLHAHTFRHSFAMHWIRVHGQQHMVELQKHLGHSDIKTTMGYLRFSPSEIGIAYKKLWD
jgi:integrase/recombinase XerC